MTKKVTITLDKQWLDKVLDAAYGYADDSGDRELKEWLTTISQTAETACEPMNFVVSLRVSGTSVGLSKYSGEDLKTLGAGLISVDERSTMRELSSWVDGPELKVAYVEGGDRDFAAYVGRPHWSDQHVRSGGSKMRASHALILAELLKRLNTAAACHNRPPVPTLKPALTYRQL